MSNENLLIEKKAWPVKRGSVIEFFFLFSKQFPLKFVSQNLVKVLLNMDIQTNLITVFAKTKLFRPRPQFFIQKWDIFKIT